MNSDGAAFALVKAKLVLGIAAGLMVALLGGRPKR
jgi:hypothetical protein